MPTQWTEAELWKIASGYRAASVLLAAAELDVFAALADGPRTAGELASAIDGDRRATEILADALAGLDVLVKQNGRYGLAGGVAVVLTADGAESDLALARHVANCQRSWAQLARVVRTGRPAEHPPSIRGEAGDVASFIEAMDNASRAAAPTVVADLGPPAFRHLLDVGGGPGTWTAAFLAASPTSTATLYDRPEALAIAERHLAAAGVLDRVTLAAGDFDADASLPGGADLAWVSAIVHMNSRRQNRDLFAKVHAALEQGGRILIRDVVMDATHARPAFGALFAVNMLVRTPAGGTYAFGELADDLAAVGFPRAELLRNDDGMNAVVGAVKA